MKVCDRDTNASVTSSYDAILWFIFHTDSLREEEASIVDSYWPYRSAKSKAVIVECIKQRPSQAVRRRQNNGVYDTQSIDNNTTAITPCTWKCCFLICCYWFRKGQAASMGSLADRLPIRHGACARWVQRIGIWQTFVSFVEQNVVGDEGSTAKKCFDGREECLMDKVSLGSIHIHRTQQHHSKGFGCWFGTPACWVLRVLELDAATKRGFEYCYDEQSGKFKQTLVVCLSSFRNPMEEVCKYSNYTDTELSTWIRKLLTTTCKHLQQKHCTHTHCVQSTSCHLAPVYTPLIHLTKTSTVADLDIEWQ